MSAKSSAPRALQTDPLSVDDILATGFYRPERDQRDILCEERAHEDEQEEGKWAGGEHGCGMNWQVR